MPDKEKRGPVTSGAASNDQPRSAHHYIAACQRRCDAARRVTPLECGCRDPYTCRCRDTEPTPHQTEAAIQAAEYLLHHALVPIFSIDQGRALWRAGRRDLAVLTTTQVVA